MRYQLVLQFPGDTLVDFDAMITLEEQFTSVLGGSAQVDGHDCGAGESNIFVFTDQPAHSFAQVRPCLERAGWLAAVRIAYRDVAGEEFTVLWPEGSTEEFTIQ